MPPFPYDFRRCKYCGEPAAETGYELGRGLAVQVCRCCDFHFLNRLDARSADASSRKLTPAAEQYLDNRLDESAPLRAQRLALVKRHLQLSGARCLDIGAGVGQFLLTLQGQGACPEGIEPSRVRREYARQRFALQLRSELVDEPCWQQGFAGSFDLVTLWDVIEHVNFPVETLRQAVHLLKPGGWLFLETPSRAALSYRLSQFAAQLSGGQLPLFLPSFYSAAPYGHKQIFTPTQMRQLLERVGLQLVEERRSFAPLQLVRNKLIYSCRKTPTPFPTGNSDG